ncbi:uncharacterized protein LOC129595945 [Paramacrobiotus metropolitanus]|uniref:uncharacterized protein LOC129595945 n=1 Tax=Paramacrobiotus metropolitanus TaxID=2943436 RepID=UPI002445E62C|nr:uncharacterized protein LOC129595945 [Paramacrobiotus metropolitanus]
MGKTRFSINSAASSVSSQVSKAPTPQRLDFTEAEAEPEVDLPSVDGGSDSTLRRSPRLHRPQSTLSNQENHQPMQKRQRTSSPEVATPKRARLSPRNAPAPKSSVPQPTDSPLGGARTDAPSRDNFWNYPNLSVASWKLVHYRFADVIQRFDQHVKNSNALQKELERVSPRTTRSAEKARQDVESELKKEQNRVNKLHAVLNHASHLRDEFKLYNVAPLYKLLDARHSTWTLADCMNKLKDKIKKSLLRSALGDKYTDFHLIFQQYRGFDPCKTEFDESAYELRIYGQRKNSQEWNWKSLMIFGSLGLRKAESLMHIAGEDFAFYPFIIGIGDSAIMKEVYRHLFHYHDGAVRAQHFSIKDMWPIIACCIFYTAKFKLDARTINLNITIEDTSIRRSFADSVVMINVASLVRKYITKLTEPLVDAAELMREVMPKDQVEEVRCFVQKEIESRHNCRWNEETMVIKRVQMKEISIKSDGTLKFQSHLQAISFLYFYSKYRTRAYLHPIHGVTEDDLYEDPPQSDDATINLPPTDDSGFSTASARDTRKSQINGTLVY